MNDFVNAVEGLLPQSNEARTENNMRAHKSTNNACLDLFFKIGSMRNQDIVQLFANAFSEDRELAARIALYARDVRGGMGERDTYRKILKMVAAVDKDLARNMMRKTPELGRWDDVLVLEQELRDEATNFYVEAILQGDRLAAKWAPRKGENANRLRKAMRLTPKAYRKAIVNGSDTVETDMCAKDWSKIDFSHVPSIASKKYRKAFARNAPERYEAWINALKAKKADPTLDINVKVNASAIFPHDVVRGLYDTNYYGYNYGKVISQSEIDAADAQWDALPNYMGDNRVLAISDVSGSMTSEVDKSGLTALDISVALGVYCATKNTGPFADLMMAFSGDSKLFKVQGSTIVEKISYAAKQEWAMNTDLNKAIQNVLDTAVKGRAKQEDMPKILLVLSDMQFDHCTTYDDRAFDMMRRKYEEAGYEMPGIVFWNIAARDNVPVTVSDRGVALVSGYSPSILKSILDSNMDELTPYGIMMKAVSKERYNPYV